MADLAPVVIVETPAGSRNKYEWDDELGGIVLDRRLFTSMSYPADYGFIDDTFAEDGDPLDALVLVSDPSFPGCRARVRVVGLFHMEDEAGPDDKLICVPLNDPTWSPIREIDEVSASFRAEIEHFFQVYKNLENKKTSTSGSAAAVRRGACLKRRTSVLGIARRDSGRRWSADRTMSPRLAPAAERMARHAVQPQRARLRKRGPPPTRQGCRLGSAHRRRRARRRRQAPRKRRRPPRGRSATERTRQRSRPAQRNGRSGTSCRRHGGRSGERRSSATRTVAAASRYAARSRCPVAQLRCRDRNKTSDRERATPQNSGDGDEQYQHDNHLDLAFGDVACEPIAYSVAAGVAIQVVFEAEVHQGRVSGRTLAATAATATQQAA